MIYMILNFIKNVFWFLVFFLRFVRNLGFFSEGVNLIKIV